MTYRQQVEKIYKKLDTLAQRGEDSYMDFRQYIDEIVQNGEYGILDDVLLTKYNTDLKSKFKNVEDLKKNGFKEIRFQTKSKFLKNLQKLYSTKKVYNLGLHFFDSDTNKYLGDIKEIEIFANSQFAYQDEKFKERISSSEYLYLQCVLGLSSSIYDAIPPYDKDYIDGTISYGTYSQVKYDGSIYECIQSYDWRYGDPITPTYSNYWTLTSIPTYSVISITGPDKTLFDKYSIAVDILKNSN